MTSNKQKLDDMMTEYGTKIIRLSYSYVKNQQLAEDIAQEVFLTCYIKFDDFEGKSSVKTWLYRITINKCKDYLKSWSYKCHVLTNQFKGSPDKNDANLPEQNFMRNEEKQYIVKTIMKLPTKYREIIFLYYYEELSFKEISKLVDVNENTLRSRMVKAKSMLQKALMGSDVDDRKSLKRVKEGYE